MTVKMVVPTWGSLLAKAGVRAVAWVMAQRRRNQGVRGGRA
jgi:hypothetical protein